MTSPYFIIEHPRRGVLKDLEWTESEKQRGRFSTTMFRNDPEIERFFSLEHAVRERDKIVPAKLRSECWIRSSVPKPNAGPFGNEEWPVVA